MTPKEHHRKLVLQRIMGMVLLAICVLCVLFASSGETPEERDCTALLLIAPLSMGLIFSKNILIY